jgi:hypothetical protein
MARACARGGITTVAVPVEVAVAFAFAVAVEVAVAFGFAVAVAVAVVAVVLGVWMSDQRKGAVPATSPPGRSASPPEELLADEATAPARPGR